ncbi:MAG: hypothetical protein WDZ94_03665 [Patescibacteria group bacterium]
MGEDDWSAEAVDELFGLWWSVGWLVEELGPGMAGFGCCWVEPAIGEFCVVCDGDLSMYMGHFVAKRYNCQYAVFSKDSLSTNAVVINSPTKIESNNIIALSRT